MSEPFIAEIKIFAGNFAPRGYAFCNGQLLAIAQNTALFSLVGTTFGGDGRTTFGLPDLRDRAPLHAGNGAGLFPRQFGSKLGQDSTTLTPVQIPAHTHTIQASSTEANKTEPQQSVWSQNSEQDLYRPVSDINTNLNGQAVRSEGGGQAHYNRQPYLTLNFIIALTGLYPSRS
jgi:microcystin-dependent protein